MRSDGLCFYHFTFADQSFLYRCKDQHSIEYTMSDIRHTFDGTQKITSHFNNIPEFDISFCCAQIHRMWQILLNQFMGRLSCLVNWVIPKSLYLINYLKMSEHRLNSF